MSDFKILYERNRSRNVGGIIFHYMSHDSFQSILDGKQMMLTRYDLMTMGCDEGKKIFDQTEKIIEKCVKSKKITQKGRDILSNKIELLKNGYIPHRFDDTNQYEDCVPYILCFTMMPNIGDGENELIRMITSRDLSMEFQANDMELKISVFDKKFDQSYKCYNAVEFVRVDYESNCLYHELKEKIEAISNDEDVECVAEEIACYISYRRFSILPAGYDAEKEVRMIFYVPKELNNHKNISNYIDRKRFKDENGNMVESDIADEEHIYLNFDESKKSITIIFNPEKEYNKKHYDKIISDAGFTPIVFDPRWEKK